jgi:hydrogen peroxide-dependent heme synthase
VNPGPENGMSQAPPATLEGWYALHQMFDLDWPALRELDPPLRRELAEEVLRLVEAPAGAGWSALYQLVGGGADFMAIHFRETLDAIGEVELALRRSELGELIEATYEFLSVTEAGLYHATAEAAAAAEPRSEEYERRIREQVEAELASAHVRTRLFPEVPDGMDYVCFYPMSKRRTHPDNWYALPVAERNRLMREHGLSGRRYAGKIFQVITGAVGLDDWEWGVTLYARDPLEFKRIVTELRYDEASTRYGEFGSFFVGRRLAPAAWAAAVAAD